MQPESNLCINGVWYSRDVLIAEVEKMLSEDISVVRLAASAADPLAFYAGLAYCVKNNCGFIAIPSGWSQDQTERSLKKFPVTGFLRSGDEKFLVLEERNLPSCCDGSGLFFFTSGTTGEPKAIFHEWKKFQDTGSFAARKLSGSVWYLAYEPAGYAGFQVYFSSMGSSGQLIIPAKDTSFQTHAENINHYGVQIISATPTWWRMLVSGWPRGLELPELSQATLGGEVVDQATIDLVSQAFKPQTLTHIYASSEAGSAIIVSDRIAGFPADTLEKSGVIQVRVVNGVLQVKSPYGQSNNKEAGTEELEWLDTGDLVEKKQGRYYFCGRKDNRINIGGAKVSPEEVEIELLGLHDVQNCHVYGKKNPITGVVLVADIVIKEGGGLSPADIREYLLPRLEKHKLPHYIRFVESIGVSANGKKIRQ